ncbi:MAG: hypothetical protein MUF34_09570 [Polyangiaceae bacterium]|nr:hypothetical protein [Polyangiaceae bacterium]
MVVSYVLRGIVILAGAAVLGTSGCASDETTSASQDADGVPAGAELEPLTGPLCSAASYFLHNPTGTSNRVSVTIKNNGTQENSPSVASPSGTSMSCTSYTDRKECTITLPSCASWRNTTAVHLQVGYRAYSSCSTPKPIVTYNFNDC